MRTTRAEIGQTGRDFFGVIRCARLVQQLQARLDPVGAAPFVNQDAANPFGDHNRVQRHAGREQFIAPIIPPAVNPPPAPIIKDRFFDLHFQQLALFLDHHDQVQPLGPVAKTVHIQRPSLANFVGGDAQTVGLGPVHTQQFHRMGQIQPVLARRHKTDFRARFTPDPFVNFIRLCKGFCGDPLVINHPRLLQNRRVDQADVQPAFGHLEFRRDELHPVRVAINHAGDLDGIFHHFQAGPDTGKAA